MYIELNAYIEKQIAWSTKIFGSEDRTKGIIDHIKKELIEIEQKPKDVVEWIDVIILALDGAWRNGHSSSKIVEALIKKQQINLDRSWPDWKVEKKDKAIEHIR